MFDVLSDYLAAERKDVSYQKLSKTLGVPETSVKRLVHNAAVGVRQLKRALSAIRPCQLKYKNAAETLRPGDEAQFVRLHQAGMRGHDAHAEAVGAAFGGGNAALVNVVSVARFRLVGILS